MSADPLSLRVAAPSDGTAIAAIYGPIVRDTVISFEADPPTDQTMAERISATLPTHPWLVAEADGVLAGYAYASQHRSRSAYRWSVDVSVYIAAAQRGQGVGSTLYGALFRVLAHQGYCQAFAGITLPNPASVRLHESLGFVPIGVYRAVGFKHGTWLDVGWWQRPLAPTPASPSEIVPFAALRDDRSLARLLSRRQIPDLQ